jgi:hypothetical protein
LEGEKREEGYGWVEKPDDRGSDWDVVSGDVGEQRQSDPEWVGETG